AATASKDGKARLWDAETGSQMAELPAGAPVWTVRFSPDGRHLLTAAARHDPENDRGSVQLWDVATRQPARAPLAMYFNPPRKLGGPVTALRFSPDGLALLMGCWKITLQPTAAISGEASLWDLQASQGGLSSLPAPDPVKVVAFSPDGRTCLTGGILVDKAE